MQSREFDAYVQRRLDHWGQEFCLARDCEYLGHKSKDMLQVLIEHRGEMPPRPTGFKPLEIDQLAMQVEDVVRDIARDAPLLGWVLRAYYCGSGRRAVERYELAQELAGRSFGRRSYYQYERMGFHRVAGALTAIAREPAMA